ncbi:hypothetical protein MD484_g7312, partial [Candolleomyces efflorescens]
MASRYSYPAQLDSDDEGSIEYDWENDSQVDDRDDLSYDVRRPPLNRRGSSSAVPATPPPRYSALPGPLCVVCKIKPPYNKNGKSYPTCGLTCAAQLQASPGPSPHPLRNFMDIIGNHAVQRSPSNATNRTPRRAMGQHVANTSHSPFHPQRAPRRDKPLCVVCKERSVYKDYATCGLTCAAKLREDGPSDSTLCTYCLASPKLAGKEQCGQKCADKAKVACLFCKIRPKNGRYHLCGRTCKRIAMESTPLILEIPKEHTTYEMVENKFKSNWTAGASNPLPTISKIFKIIENNEFLKPYDQYRFLISLRVLPSLSSSNILYYHIGNGWVQEKPIGTMEQAANASSTSFNVSIAKASGAFGAGVYTSSASNKAYSYSTARGALILTKVVLGKVVFDRKAGTMSLNETIVYSNDAIRPVFLILFQ